MYAFVSELQWIISSSFLNIILKVNCVLLLFYSMNLNKINIIVVMHS